MNYGNKSKSSDELSSRSDGTGVIGSSREATRASVVAGDRDGASRAGGEEGCQGRGWVSDGECDGVRIGRDGLAVFEGRHYNAAMLSDDAWEYLRALQDRALQIKTEGKPRRVRKATTAASVGLVYLVQADNGLVKIGWTTNFKQRLASLQTASPSSLKVLALIDSSVPTQLEQQLHRQFASRRIRGEWFKLSARDIERAKRAASS